MLTGKEFSGKIFSLIGEHPYKWARKNGLKRHVIDQLKRPKIPGPKILNQLAVALGKDVDSLIYEEREYENSDIYTHKTIKSPHIRYKGPERRETDRRKTDRRLDDIKKKIMGNLVTTFNNSTKAGKECITRVIDFLETEVVNYKKN